MRVQVELFLHLQRYGWAGKGPHTVELPDGATLRDLVARLGIPVNTQKIALVNGRLRPLADPLGEGETVSIFPPLEGG
jgi:molybdopterin converting factor small subunit